MGAPVDLRVGTDVQIISKVEASIRRHGREYLDRMFTPREVQACGGYDGEPNLLAPGLAGCCSAKEAALRALRPTAIIPERRDIEVVQMPGGWVRLRLFGSAKELADAGGLVQLEVSLSHCDTVAVATVVGVALGANRLP